MTRQQSPCYGCSERWVTDSTTCHAHCERFIADEASQKAKKEQAYARRMADVLQAELINKRKLRVKKRSKNGR